jgi:hypothetical protein
MPKIYRDGNSKRELVWDLRFDAGSLFLCTIAPDDRVDLYVLRITDQAIEPVDGGNPFDGEGGEVELGEVV